MGRPERLSLGGVVRAAMGTYSRHIFRVTFVAILLTGSLGVADAALARAIDLEEGGGWWPTVLFGLYSLVTVTGVLALEFYAGLLDKIVAEDQYGHSSHTIRQVLQTLSYGRLVLASMLLTTMYAVGTILFIVPGIVALTLFSLTGPLINIEGLRVVSAMRRSARLVLPQFWRVLVLVTAPLLLEDYLVSLAEEADHDLPLWLVFLVSAALAATVNAFVGLLVTTLAHSLSSASRSQEAPTEPQLPR